MVSSPSGPPVIISPISVKKLLSDVDVLEDDGVLVLIRILLVLLVVVVVEGRAKEKAFVVEIDDKRIAAALQHTRETPDREELITIFRCDSFQKGE